MLTIFLDYFIRVYIYTNYGDCSIIRDDTSVLSNSSVTNNCMVVVAIHTLAKFIPIEIL